MRPSGVDLKDLAACRALLCSGSRSFFAASLLLPKRVRAPATALYAFCRVADDAIDLGDDPAAALIALNTRFDAAYAGMPAPNPVDRAFAATVKEFEIPKALPAALIEGLAWDAAGRRYANFAELLDYAARVAGAVGVMMAVVMGVRDSQSLARASDLGVAMQLSNIARDVGEDAHAGRIFLPLDWLQEAGVDATALLKAPTFTPALGSVVRRLLEEADALYARAESGIARLPVDCRLGIAAARRIYAGIGTEVAKAGFDSVARRARVRGRRKLALAGLAIKDALLPAHGLEAAALPANIFLLRDAVVEPVPQPRAIVKLITLFERLERAQHEAAGQQDGSLA
jgi:phytoene synthase